MIGLANLAARHAQRLDSLRLDGSSKTDSWQSTLGGFGGRSDRGRGDRMQLLPRGTLDDATLTAAYKDLWLVRRIVEARCDDALRGGWGVDESEKLENFKRLNVATHTEGAFQRACHMADLKGGAGLFIGYKGSEGQSLLEPAPVGAEVAFLEVFDRFQLVGEQRVEDVDSPEYDRPQIWKVIGVRRQGLRFHQSRMIRFPGAAKGGDLGSSDQDKDWGYSILQAVWDDVVRYGVFWQNIALLMQLASVGVLKISGLIQMLASKNSADAEARIDLLNETLSLSKLMLLDAKYDESYHREAVAFTDLPALLEKVERNTAGAFKMPVTRLFGSSPGGLNATGESDTRGWYDEVAAYRQVMIEPRLEAVLAITERREIDVEFDPLWQPTETEQATVRNLEIQGHEKLWSMKIVSAEEIRAAMIDDKWPESTVSGPPEEEPEPDAPQDPEAANLFTDAVDREDAPSAQAIEQRLARMLVKSLRDDPDVLGEIAGPGGDVGDIRGHLVERARDMLPPADELSGERRATMKEVRKLKTFKEEIGKELPALAQEGASHYHENDRRSQGALVDDPDHVGPFRLPGDTNGAETYSQNQRRKKAGLPVLTGPRGGRYYVTVGGSKSYV